MNLRLKQIAINFRMLRRTLGRTEAKTLIRDAIFNGPARFKAQEEARLEQLRYFVANMKEERAKFSRRLELGIMVAR